MLQVIIGVCIFVYLFNFAVNAWDERQAKKTRAERERKLKARGMTIEQADEENRIRRFERKCDLEYERSISAKVTSQ